MSYTACDLLQCAPIDICPINPVNNSDIVSDVVLDTNNNGLIENKDEYEKNKSTTKIYPKSMIALTSAFGLIKSSGKKLIFNAYNNDDKLRWMFTILMYVIQSSDNRFNSFAPERNCVRAKWYVDGKDAFKDIAFAIDRAKKEIFITGWCVNPCLYLLRDDEPNAADSRLDILLKHKASQGVKIYIVMWKETAIANLNLYSRRSKMYLRSLYPRNIYVITHPKKFPIMYTHHQKSVVIDQSFAFVGGLDLAYGRWDSYKHPITDTGHTHMKYPLNDYINPQYNSGVKFEDKLDNFRDVLDREFYPRQPW
jgi:phospholipase D1/2